MARPARRIETALAVGRRVAAEGGIPEGLDLSTWRGADRRGPVNVVFHLPATGVVRRLEAAGWRRTRARRREILLDGRRLAQDMDLVQGSWWGRRLHLRLWDLGDECVGQAHGEVRVWDPRQGRVGSHKVLSQDTGRNAVRALFPGGLVPGASHGTDHDGWVFVATGSAPV